LMGDFIRANRDCCAALKIDLTHPKGLYRRCEALLGLKKWKEAEAVLRTLELRKAAGDPLLVGISLESQRQRMTGAGVA